jgi:hypothetical protein
MGTQLHGAHVAWSCSVRSADLAHALQHRHAHARPSALPPTSGQATATHVAHRHQQRHARVGRALAAVRRVAAVRRAGVHARCMRDGHGRQAHCDHAVGHRGGKVLVQLIKQLARHGGVDRQVRGGGVGLLLLLCSTARCCHAGPPSQASHLLPCPLVTQTTCQAAQLSTRQLPSWTSQAQHEQLSQVYP